MEIKKIEPHDYDYIVRLQNRVHPPFLRESKVVLTSKAYASPDTCFIAQDREGKWGYILAIPYPSDDIPALTESIDPLDESDNIFIHDCVVEPDCRGKGVAGKLFSKVEKNARKRGFKQISLVAVVGADSYWKQRGFVPGDLSVKESYGDDAVYMVKDITEKRAVA